MAINGFNVGTTLSLDEMNLAVDYLISKESFEPDLQGIKDKITGKEKEKITDKKVETLE